MTKNTIIGIGVAAVILIVVIVWLFVGRQGGEVTLTPQPTPAGFESQTTPAPFATESATPSGNLVEITITDSGFSPANVEIQSGGTITWVNNTNRQVQIAANPHPVHTGNREVSAGKFTLELAPGAKETVVITKTGTFGFHNHLSPGQLGTIVVK